MLKSIRNSLVTTSILYIIAGVLLVMFPATALNTVCTLIGIVTLAYGAVRIVSYFKDGGLYSNRFDLFIGVILAVAGVFLVACPQFVVSLIPIALGIYILVDSFTAAKKALDMKALGFDKWWFSFTLALVLAVFGLIMVFNPFGTLTSLVKFIGIAFIFDGAYTLANTVVADRVFRE